MKVLITGGAGFIGSHLTDRLIENGHSVLVIDNLSTGKRENLTDHKNLQVIEGSIADYSLVDRSFKDFRPDHVVHAAAAYKDPQNWNEDSMTNVIGTINVVKKSKESGIKRLIYFQTSLCYGLHPLESPITLNHPLFAGKFSGGSSYAISKTAGEQYIELSGLDFISFRLANAYGPRNISGPLPTFVQRLTEGKPCFIMDTRRDFIYITDLIEIVMKALKGDGRKGYYHVSSGKDYSIKELFDYTVRELGLHLREPIEVRSRGKDDVFSILLDPKRTNVDFDWKVTVCLEKGIKETVEWYRKHRIIETFTHLKINE